MSVLATISYGLEISSYVPQFRVEVDELGLGDHHLKVSASDAGSAVFGAAIYDISVADERANPVERAQSRRLAGLSMMYMNVLDDAIDDPRLALNASQKAKLITEAVDTAWGRSKNSEHILPRTKFFRTAKILGKAISGEVCESDANHSYAETMAEFAEAEANHGQDMTPEGLLASVIQLGRPCGSIMSSSVEVVTGKKDDTVITAAEGLGVYGMLLDHAFEVNADLRDHSPTIVTATITRDGDSWGTRRAAREVCLDAANDVRQAGMENLSRGQRHIYTAMARLFDARYKFIVRLKDNLIRSGRN